MKSIVLLIGIIYPSFIRRRLSVAAVFLLGIFSPSTIYFLENIKTSLALDLIYSMVKRCWTNGKIMFPEQYSIDWVGRKIAKYSSHSIGANNRFDIVSDTIFKQLEVVGEGVRVLALACGSSTALGYALDRAKLKNYLLVLSDASRRALSSARDKFATAELNLDNVEFLRSTHRQWSKKLKGRKFDIVEICGFLDYLDDDQATVLIRESLDLLEEGGMIVLSAMKRTRWAIILEVVYKWKVVYRDVESFGRIINLAGGKHIDIMVEDRGIFLIATAIKRTNGEK